MGLATADKQTFDAVFDTTEEEVLMGPWRIQMILDLIDEEEEAPEKLLELQALITLHSTTEAQ